MCLNNLGCNFADFLEGGILCRAPNYLHVKYGPANRICTVLLGNSPKNGCGTMDAFPMTKGGAACSTRCTKIVEAVYEAQLSSPVGKLPALRTVLACKSEVIVSLQNFIRWAR